MIEIEDDNDDQLLSLIEAAEADAIAAGGSRKRQKLSMADASDGVLQDIQEEEGSYMAALRGSRSSLWQRQQQKLGPQKKAGGGTGFIAGSSGTAPPFAASAGGGAGACFKCGMTGHWARECGQGGSVDQTEGLVAEKLCPCGSGTCHVLTSNTAKNPGRKFYRCPLKVENGGCNFFEWFDSPSSGFSSSVIAPNHQSNVSVPVLLCPCGAGSCLVLVSRTGKNEGQQYYKCPGNEGGGSCGFFKWCSERNSVSKQSAFTQQFQGSSKNFNSQPVDRSNSSCYKCGQDGHWAKDCQNQSSYSFPCDSKTQLSSSGSGSCFKCGKSGHWARDCPAQNYVGGKRNFDYS